MKNSENQIDKVIEDLLSTENLNERLPFFHEDYFNLSVELQQIAPEKAAVLKQTHIIDKLKLIALIKEHKITLDEAMNSLKVMKEADNQSLSLYHSVWKESEVSLESNHRSIQFVATTELKSWDKMLILPVYKVNDDNYQWNETDWDRLIADSLKNECEQITVIIDCMELGETFDDHLTKQLKSILMLHYVLYQKLFASQKNVLFLTLCNKEKDASQFLFSLSGYYRTLVAEHPRMSGRVIMCSHSEMAKIVKIETGITESITEVKYEQNKRLVRVLERSLPTYQSENIIKENGVYIVTGGFGKVALAITEYLIKNNASKVVLLVRRKPSNEEKRQLEKLRAGNIEWVEVSLIDADALTKLFHKISKQYKKINSVFHCAGTIKDCLIQNKTEEMILAVLEPKVEGTRCLYECLNTIKPETLVMCSSLASITGNQGQSDYGVGNGFLNQLASYHAAKKRDWNVVSVAWPLWKDGGMQVSGERADIMTKYTGMVPMPNDVAFLVMDTAISENLLCTAVFYGYESKIQGTLAPLLEETLFERENDVHVIDETETAVTLESQTSDVTDYFLMLLEEVSQIRKEEVDVASPFQEYGIDSIMLTRINERLDKDGYNIPKTLLYEVDTIQELIDYLNKEHGGVKQEIRVNDAEKEVRVEDGIQELLQETFMSVSGIEKDTLDIECSFDEYGMDSIMMQRFLAMLEEKEIFLPNTVLLDAKNLSELASLCETEYKDRFVGKVKSADKTDAIEKMPVNSTHLANKEQQISQNSTQNRYDETMDIAIIGMDVRTAGAKNPEELWNLLLKKNCFIQEVPLHKWNHDKYYSKNKADTVNGKTYCKYGAFIPDGDCFDAQFFHISPIEADIMDPQERILLESVWHALENADYTKEELKEKYKNKTMPGVGVFVGATQHSYSLAAVKEWEKENYVIPSSWQWAFANRISHVFDFTGPSIPVDTGCSSSLTALELACQSLKNGQSHMAVVSGVNLYHHPSVYIGASKLGLLSTQDTYSVLNEDSDGFIPGEGVATILIKPLKDAKADGDTILGVIKGIDVNHTGNTNTFFAPDRKTEEQLFEQVSKQSGVGLDKITYLEMGTTGSSLSDVVEFTALKEAFQRAGATQNHCALGSIKQNIGHTESASSLIAIVKILLQFQNSLIVPNLFGNKINREIDMNHSPFYLARNQSEQKIEYAMINAVSAGGANACIILENYQSEKRYTDSRELKEYTICLSARTQASLDQYVKEVSLWLSRHTDTNLELMEYRLNHRTRFQQKAVFKGYTVQELIQALANYVSGEENNQHMGEPAIVTRKQAQYILLPGYSFEKKSYWVTDRTQDEIDLVKKSSLGKLLDENESTFGRQCFSKKFTGSEFYISDHLGILPAVAYIEMICEATAHSFVNLKLSKIKNLIFMKPFVQENEPNGLQIEIKKEDSQLEMLVYSKDTGDKFARASLQMHTDIEQEKADWISELNFNENAKEEAEGYYNHLEALHSCFGPRFRGIKEIVFEDNTAYTHSGFSGSEHAWEDYYYHPALLDSGFQTVVSLAYHLGADKEMIFMPYVVEGITLFVQKSKKPITYVKAVVTNDVGSCPEEYQYQVEYADEDGNLIMRVQNYSIAPLQAKHTKMETTAEEAGNTVQNRPNDQIKLKQLEERIEQICLGVLRLDTPIEHSDNLLDYGFESISYTELSTRMNKAFKTQITPVLFFEHNTIEKIANYLAGIVSEQKLAERKPDVMAEKNDFIMDIENRYLEPECEKIAIIGMSGAFPQSNTIDDLWKNVLDEKVLTSNIPVSRWNYHDYKDTYCHTGGFMNDVERFDPKFFGISPADAILMDPQQRLALEHTWMAMEDAGYSSKDLKGTNTSVFIGVSNADYGELLVKNNIPTVMTHSMVTNRISYVLELTGKSEPCDAACASSLVAIDRAVKTLREKESDLAFAGGVNLLLSPSTYEYECKAKALSQSGICRTFDKDADGYVRGEGIGIVVLKRLEDAIRDKDAIYATILGTNVGHAGFSTGLTVPNASAQARIIKGAYEDAKIDMDTVGYMEAHGTGTKLGDPIEIDGLKQAYQETNHADKNAAPCILSSVKTNIGHLEAASGIASLCKAVKVLQTGIIPPVVNFKEQNPYIHLEGSRFKIASTQETCNPSSNGLRRAGISAFGIGGVNAHIVLEEYKEKIGHSSIDEQSDESRLIVFSAKNRTSLEKYVTKILQFIEQKEKHIENQTEFLEQLSYTLLDGRDAFNVRCAFTARNLTELRNYCRQFLQSEYGSEIYVCENTLKNSTWVKSEETKKAVLTCQDMSTLAEYWAKGCHVTWKMISHSIKYPNRMHLPSYEFEKERYWYTDLLRKNSSEVKTKETTELEHQGFMVHHFSNQDKMLQSHVVMGKMILPAAAYLSMMYEDTLKKAGKVPFQLGNISWRSNIDVTNHPADIETRFEKKGDAYKITLSEQSVLASGSIHAKEDTQKDLYLDIPMYEQKLKKQLSKHEIYSYMRQHNMFFGDILMTISSMKLDVGCAVCSYQVSENILDSWQDNVLNPYILDAAFQSIMAVNGHRKIERDEIRLPFSLGSMDVYHRPKLTGKIISLLKKAGSKENTYLIMVIDNDGRIAIKLTDYTIIKKRL